MSVLFFGRRRGEPPKQLFEAHEWKAGGVFTLVLSCDTAAVMDWGNEGLGGLILARTMLNLSVGSKRLAFRLGALLWKEVVRHYPDNWCCTSDQVKRWCEEVQTDDYWGRLHVQNEERVDYSMYL